MMNVDLNQILAVGLTVSQLFTQSVDRFRPAFNPQTDREQVAQLLHAGCEILKKEFGNSRVDMDTTILQNLDELEAAQKGVSGHDTGMGDGELDSDLTTPAAARKEKTLAERLGKIDIPGIRRAYRQFCMLQKVDQGIDLEPSIQYYNAVMKDLPDPSILKNLRLPQTSFVLDRDGQRFTEIFIDGQRRRWLPLSEMPEHLKLAFIDTEDKRFYKHIGLDLRGIVRAFTENSLQSTGRPQGASTITQQVVKNLLLNNMKDWDKPNFERKIPEMYLAVLLEKYLSKDQILELYLNQIYLGRTSSGVEMAAQSYFKKSARQVDVAEAAFLAAMAKGPTFYSPDKHPDRALDRRQYVLNEMKKEEDRKAKEGDPSARPLTDADFQLYATKTIQFEDFESPRTRSAYYFVNEIIREAKGLNYPLTSSSFTVRSTVDPTLQKFTDETLRQGLIDYEATSKSWRFIKAAGNIEKELREHDDVAWDEILNKTRPDSYWDLHWPLAVILETPGTAIRKDGRKQVAAGWKVGLADGSTVKLTGLNGGASSVLKPFDLVYVEPNGKQAKLIIPPRVQGAMVVIENATGRILAMSGGFSYAESPFNRATQSAVQPGSTLKPFTYLAALHMNYQPNTLIANTPFHLDPIERGGRAFEPGNYNGNAYGLVTMRQGLERSLNIPAARMMSKLGNTAKEGLDYLVGLTQTLGIYDQEVDKKFPFVLGSQPAKLLNMVRAYATIANDGLQPSPHVIEEITADEKPVYNPKQFSLKPIGFDGQPDNQDRVAFYQLRRLLMTTMQEKAGSLRIDGTANALKDLYGYIGCKTGTTNNFRNAWFIGFTDKITVGTWISYDNDKIRSSLGKGFTGASIALPMAEKVIRRSFDLYGKRPLPGPPNEIRAQIVEYPIDRATGEFDIQGDYREVFRVAGNSRSPLNTWQSALGPNELYMSMAGFGPEPDYGDQQAYDDAPYGHPNDQYRYDRRDDDNYYMPGAETPYEQSQRQRRQEDSFFSGFPFFQ
jgi:penicillin-binding protein 1A